MSGDDVFFDTNVLVYLLSNDAEKADRAEQILAIGGTISVQVLNEFASVASRKLGMHWVEIREILSIIRWHCHVVPLTADHHARALDIAERHGLAIYDALIWAAAIASGCSILYSEDMQHGQEIDGVVLTNPFFGREG
jgi:predicted nucleic acid-binding protein